MKIAIMQPYFFPYIGYFQLINAVDKFVIFDDVNYINKGWINRNRILVNGEAHMFTMPLKEASQNRLIRDIEVSEEEGWKTKFLRTVELSYKKSPHFDQVFPMISRIVMSEIRSLSEKIRQSIAVICEYLGIGTIIQATSSIYDNRHLKGEDRILDICRQERAGQYINPPGGVGLYSKDRFDKEGIKLRFIKPRPVIYRQFDNEFIPWLSIIDVLMFNSREKAIEYMSWFDLV